MRVRSFNFAIAVLLAGVWFSTGAGARDPVTVAPRVNEDASLRVVAGGVDSEASTELMNQSMHELMRKGVEPVASKKQSALGTSASRRLWMEVTAYCPCTKCCGPSAIGITASGLPVTHNEGRFVAADTRVLPFGTHVRIAGYGQGLAVPVIDRGGAIKGNKLDVYFPTHDEALQWGRRWVLVTVNASTETTVETTVETAAQ